MPSDPAQPRQDQRLSVPRRHITPPRALTPQQLATLLAAADVLIPGTGGSPAATAAPEYRTWLQRALAARADALEVLAAFLDELAGAASGEMEQRFREQHASGDPRFHLLSSVVAGAYLMVPEIRVLAGYPGQHPSPPRVDEAADELSGGILDAVLQRGEIYVSPESGS